MQPAQPLTEAHVTTGRANFSLSEKMEKKWRKLHFLMEQTCREKLVKISYFLFIFSAIFHRENISFLWREKKGN
jgi:hypothetical protein